MNGFFRRTNKPVSHASKLVIEQLEHRLVPAVTFHGGSLLANPDVNPLFYGAQWQSNLTLASEETQIIAFFQTIVGSAYLTSLTQYNVSAGTYVGSSNDTSTAPQTLDDSAIQKILLNDIGGGLLGTPDSDRIYFVFTPPGTEVTLTRQGVQSTSGTEANTPHFTGYHSAIAATPDIFYVVIPYPGGVNQGVSTLAAVDQLTIAASRQLVDTATDPLNGSGWTASAQTQSYASEIGDLDTGAYGGLLGYQVQFVWSNAYNFALLPEPSNLSTAANDLTHSAEYFSNMITGDYYELLGRLPAPSEVAQWVAMMEAGTTDAEVLNGFLSSAEYYAHVGGTNQDWVASLYVQVLNRQADTSGENGWLSALASGTSRLTIANDFTTSPERDGEIVAMDYQQYLGRSASPTEIASWVPTLEHGTSPENLAAMFVDSSEAFFLVSNCSINNWLNLAYSTILERAPDPAGAASWIQFLDQGL